MKKKRILSVYIIFLILCILITAVQCDKTTEEFKEELYGTTTDKTIELDEDTNISIEFKPTENNLRGISVKFQSEHKFEDEKMKAELFDSKSNKLLAESSAVLKYERIQNKDGGSFIYFGLSVDDIRNKEVKLVLSLENANVHPLLVVSRNALNTSSLKINSKKSNDNLVFKTRYFLTENKNLISSLANGLFLIVLGSLLFVFAYMSGELAKRKDSITFVKFSNMLKKLYNFIIEKCKPFGFLMVLGFIGLYIVYVYKCGVSNAILENDYYFLKIMYAVLGILVLLVASMIFWLCIWKKMSVEKLYIPMALCIGILFSLVICLDTVPDEPSHVDTAYALSNEILQIPESEKPGYIYKRIEDIDADAEERQSLSAENYKWLYHKLLKKTEDTTLVECAARSNLGNGGKIYYFPQAIGISIGRLLGLSMLPTMMLGRLFSLICYVIITYIAIKKTPVGKVSLFLIGITPISLQQAASMSYDGMINAVALLYIAFNIYIIYSEKEIKCIDLTVISITGSLLATVKGGTYIPLCFLPLMLLWRKKKILKREKYCTLSLVALFLFLFIKDRLIGTISRLSAEQGTAIGGSKNQELYTFGYFIQHPSRLFGLFINTFHKQGDQQLRNLLGGNLAWRDININWYIVIIFLMLILLSCIRQEKETYIPRADKLYMGMLSAGCFGLLELSMLLVWTPVTFNFITGVQGRYFIPFFFLILLCLRNSFFVIKKNIKYQIILLYGMVDLIVVLHVLLVALER